MAKLPRGLYETLVSEALAETLRGLDATHDVRHEALASAEAPDRLAFYLGRLIERGIAHLPERERVRRGGALAGQVVRLLCAEVSNESFAGEHPDAAGTVLRQLSLKRPDGEIEPIEAPLTPLLDTTLLTNAPGEPRIGRQIESEVASADRIDVLMAFVRMSGIAPWLRVFRRHITASRPLRVLTTSFTGTTEAAALDALRKLGAEVRVSYDLDRTRLHAKAWIFHRDSGFSTAFIGSSNITHSGQVSGREWNLRVSGARNPAVLDKMIAVFESYWENQDFRPYARDEFLAKTQRPSHTTALLPIEIRPDAFQQRLLEEIAVARAMGHHRNLLVSATGTGKTVMAAIDYARLAERDPRTTLLFVAHREEILTQSLDTFRQVLHDSSFGELWVNGKKSERLQHVFASIQTLSQADWSTLAPDHFNVVIVDEFHHAAASSYEKLLNELKPRELLGLTATPERADGRSVLHWFDGRIAAELRLWDAIEQQHLVPFVYFGLSDGVDLTAVPWRRGTGYQRDALSNVYTGNEAWARLVIRLIHEKLGDFDAMKALGFCVTVAHAVFMAEMFNRAGVLACALSGESDDATRRAALQDLRQGRLKVIFSVDLFNEGLDIQAINTVLMLRPTESPTVFIQQLGRGLRKSKGKTECVVFDFVAQHRSEFRYELRFAALLRQDVETLRGAVAGNFPFLPSGCHLELDEATRERLMARLKALSHTRWSALLADRRSHPGLGLAAFLDETGRGLSDLYRGVGRSAGSWARLSAEAEGRPAVWGRDEETMLAACGRLLHVDDLLRISQWRAWLSCVDAPDVAALTPRARRLLRMLVASLEDQLLGERETLARAAQRLWASAVVRHEMLEIVDVLQGRLRHLAAPIEALAPAPLCLHAQYTRIEILAAMGAGDDAKTPRWQEGVKYVEEAKTDLLLITLDKSDGRFSPSTRYRDYAISHQLLHWESQSQTRAQSPTGLRYQHHHVQGSRVMLFARGSKSDRAFYCLGPARYVQHQGEMPMAITWRLETPLPNDLFLSFAAAVA